MIFHDRRRLGAIQRPFVASGLPHTVPDVYLYYPFDNASTSGSTCLDRSGNGFNAAIAGFVTTGATGQIAQAYSTAPTQTAPGLSLTANNLTGLGGNTAFTYCWWARSIITTQQIIFVMGGTGQAVDIILNRDGTGGGVSGAISAYMAPGSIGTQFSGFWLNDGSWHHFAMTYDGVVSAAAHYAFYVDASSKTLTSDGSLSGAALNISPTNNAVMFGDSLGGSMLSGSIDDFRAYTRALSSTEITNIFNAGAAGGT